MPKKSRADDDEDTSICLGFGCIVQLTEGGRRRRIRQPIGFVHFPEKPKAKAARLRKASKHKRKR